MSHIILCSPKATSSDVKSDGMIKKHPKFFNPYPANMENRVSSYQGQQLADGI